MATLVNNIPYPDGLDLTDDQLNGAGEHLHNLFSSRGDMVQNLWQTPDNLQLTSYYDFGYFQDMNNFDILAWGKFLNPNFASYL